MKGVRRPYCSLDGTILSDRLVVMQKRIDTLTTKLNRAATTLERLTAETSYRTLETQPPTDTANSELDMAA
eukprot:3709571-Rhodomonas_salina.1